MARMCSGALVNTKRPSPARLARKVSPYRCDQRASVPSGSVAYSASCTVAGKDGPGGRESTRAGSISHHPQTAADDTAQKVESAHHGVARNLAALAGGRRLAAGQL